MMSIYPIVHIQLSFVQFSLLCYEFYILSKTDCKSIYYHFRRDHESSSFWKLARNKWICREICDFFFKQWYITIYKSQQNQLIWDMTWARTNGKKVHRVKSVCIRSFSGRYFLTYRLNTDGYFVSLHIQFACRKILIKNPPFKDTFHAVVLLWQIWNS